MRSRRRAAIAALGGVVLLLSVLPVRSGDGLTFDERVAAARAIACVWHGHRIGDPRPCSEAIDPARIARRVRSDLARSVALQID